MKKRIVAVLVFLSAHAFVSAQPLQTENLIIITLDGFRWQDLFYGADPSLLGNRKYVTDKNTVKSFWHEDAFTRREKLLPFFWNVIAQQGQLYGNRSYNNYVNCKNPFWFSYPGYSEMLVGFVDRHANSNRKVVNRNYTVLEYINKQPQFSGKVAVYSTWDVIPFIIRQSVSGIPANEGKADILPQGMSPELIPGLSRLADSANHEYRDAITFHAAFNYLRQDTPRVMYISFDETDSFAHRGRYDQYLDAAHRTDKMISELWSWLQSQPQYSNKTTLLITTDHGRGKNRWTSHGRIFRGSNQVWFAVLGPDTPPLGEIKTRNQFYQKQIAKTAAAFLNLDYYNVTSVGEIIHPMFPPKLVIADKTTPGQ
jgi:hypothetical protein